MKNPRPRGLLGILHVFSSGGGDGRGPVFGAELEVFRFLSGCCSARLSDKIHCAVMSRTLLVMYVMWR